MNFDFQFHQSVSDCNAASVSSQAGITALGTRKRSLEANVLITEILNINASNSYIVHNIHNYNCSQKSAQENITANTIKAINPKETDIIATLFHVICNLAKIST